MLQEFLNALFFIFVAEMGDKTQLMAMSFATKYPLKKVLLGVGIGSFLNHGLAVALGTYLTQFVPLDAIRFFAALAFILFGLWTLKIDGGEAEERASAFGPVMTVALAFFIGELGDKTQLTAITLSTRAVSPLATLAGTVSGMLVTSTLGILLGCILGKRLPEIPLKIISAMVFIGFGLAGLSETVPAQYRTIPYVVGFLSVLSAILLWLLKRALGMLIKEKQASQLVATQLVVNTERIRESLEQICFMDRMNHACSRAECSIFQLKRQLLEAQERNSFSIEAQWTLPTGSKIAPDQVCGLKESLLEAVEACLRCNPHESNYVGNQARQVLETLYFGETLPYKNNRMAYYYQVQKRDPQFFYDLKTNF